MKTSNQRRLLRWKQLKEIIPVSSATIWRWEKDGLFPKRITIGKNSVVWDSKQVNEWIERKTNDDTRS